MSYTTLALGPRHIFFARRHISACGYRCSVVLHLRRPPHTSQPSQQRANCTRYVQVQLAAQHHCTKVTARPCPATRRRSTRLKILKAGLRSSPARRAASARPCVEINHCVGCTKALLGDDAAVLAPSSGEEPASPRHRACVASMARREILISTQARPRPGASPSSAASSSSWRAAATASKR